MPHEWTIAACDIGQGDAVLLRSGGAVALIDTGPDPGPLDACLARLGLAHIDLLVLTHFDLDHVGGVSGGRGAWSMCHARTAGGCGGSSGCSRPRQRRGGGAPRRTPE